MSGEGRREAHARLAAAAPVSVDQVSGAVAEWVDNVGRFLGVLQVALEESRPRDDASPEVRALSGQLPALIRQCRAQVPTPEMIRIWVKSLSDDEPQQSVAADA
jgi:hypothetical protein